MTGQAHNSRGWRFVTNGQSAGMKNGEAPIPHCAWNAAINADSQALLYSCAMREYPTPVYRTAESVILIGVMAVYDTQAEASERIPHQWRDFLKAHPALDSNTELRGASPCTGDGKIHYLTGVAHRSEDGSVMGDRLNLEAGEYAVVQVNDAALLRETWVWLLRDWLPASGRRERNAPEFEKFAGISESGLPVGPVEIWIPLEPLATSH